MTQQLKEQLTNIVQESAIADIIMSNKKDMDILRNKRLYKQWRKEVRRLKEEDFAEILKDKKQKNGFAFAAIEFSAMISKFDLIKEKCDHTDITHEISPGYERSEHSYYCNQCGFSLNSNEYDYRNITATIDN